MKKNLSSPIDPLDDDRITDEGPDSKAPLSITKRLVIGVAAAVVVCGIAVALPSLLEAFTPPAASPAADASEQPPASAMPATKSELGVTAYAAEWKETALQPNVAIQLNEYSPAQSDVPGLPFIVTAGSESINPDSIRIDVSAGTLITWGPPDYAAKQRGKTYVLSSGDTIYWSPLDEQGKAIPGCEMTVTAYGSDNTAHAVSVVISETSDFNYTAEIK